MSHNIMSIASADVLLMILYCTAASTLFSDSVTYIIFIFFECQHVKDYNQLAFRKDSPFTAEIQLNVTFYLRCYI